MNPLMPERRPDKHGNVVTRWIRQFTSRASSANLPAPLGAEPKRNRLNQNEVDELCTILQPGIIHPSTLLKNNIEFIADRDPEMLGRIKTAAQTNTLHMDYWEFKLGKGNVMSHGKQGNHERNLDECRISLAINPVLDDIAHNGGDVSLSGKYPHQFRQIVGGIMDDGDISSPPEDLVKAVLLIAYIRGLHTDESWGDPDAGLVTYKSIEQDAAYIVDHMDQVEEMLPQLRERKAYDRETIELLMNAPTASLREGML
jgi:hypothetical protein